MKRKITKPKREKVLILKTVNDDGTTYGGFKWPLKVGAKVKCENPNREPTCKGGLHGLLWGEGFGGYLNANAKNWIVFQAYMDEVVVFSDKCKAVGTVVIKHVGDKVSATEHIRDNGGAGKAIVFGTAQAGDRGTAQAGDGGTAQAGDKGTAQAGYRGTAQAGYRGTAQAGYGGTAQAGDGGTAQAGDGGTAILSFYDGNRRRIVVAYVGENGIEPNVAYKLDSNGKIVKAE